MVRRHRQDALEMNALNMNWAQYRVPLCLSLGGVFVHKEVQD